MRNSYAHTSVAPYAVRAKPGAPVAAPLEWDEVERNDMRPQKYSLDNIFRRLGQKADPWRDIKRHAQSLSHAYERLTSL
jgi:bifunctional non-homologous end joining protein LigD